MVLNAQLHWLPVILVSVDLFLSRHSCNDVMNGGYDGFDFRFSVCGFCSLLFIVYTHSPIYSVLIVVAEQVYLHPRRWRSSRPQDVVKIVWAAVAAPIVCGVWMACFTVEQVYGGSVNLAVMGSVGLVVHVAATLVLVWSVSQTDPYDDDEPLYTSLNSS